MNTIIGVGFDCPSIDECIEFDSKSSLSDGDIVIFKSDFYETSYKSPNYPSTFQGKKLYDVDSSFKVIEHSEHWQSEISNLLVGGKTVVVMLTEKTEVYIHTGRKEVSGTGRNRKETEIVEFYDNYRFMPVKNIDIHHSEGSKIFAHSNFIKSLYEHAKDYMEHKAHLKISEQICTITFATKNKEKVLGANVKVEKGNLIFIPNIEFPSKFMKDSKWTPEAKKWGSIFQSLISQLVITLNSQILETPPPVWTSNDEFTLSESEKTNQRLTESELEIQKLNAIVFELKTKLSETEALKHLLFETGKPLELAVIKSLKMLGYIAENFNDGRLELDQIILSPEGDRFIGECEGKDNKDIDISKMRQLLDSLNEDFAREEVSEKADAILFGNPQRFTIPALRTLDFTDKCKRAAEREKIALIKTADLYKVVQYITKSNDEEFKVKCRNAIKNQLGTVVIFPKIPKGKLPVTAAKRN